MSGSWRDSALEVMFETHAEQMKLGATPQQIADAIDNAYPFGDRKHWPYKAWLSARKYFFSIKGLPNKRNKPKNDLFTNTEAA